ncbi:hypothetical protein GCM10010400_60600 [Streptomyces aculeolatus]
MPNGPAAGGRAARNLDGYRALRYDLDMSKKTRKRKWRTRKGKANHGRRPA